MNISIFLDFTWLFHDGGPCHIEASPLICRATGVTFTNISYKTVIKVKLLDAYYKYTEEKQQWETPPEVFLRQGVLKTYSKFTVEDPCRSVIARRHECSPVNLLYIYRDPNLIYAIHSPCLKLPDVSGDILDPEDASRLKQINLKKGQLVT